MNRESLAWLAGLVEGEGCLTKHTAAKNKGWSRWTLAVRMTDKDVIEKAARVLRHFGLHPSMSGPYMNGTNARKPIYAVSVGQAHEVYAIVAMLYSFMGMRRQAKCEEYFMWYKTHTKGRK